MPGRWYNRERSCAPEIARAERPLTMRVAIAALVAYLGLSVAEPAGQPRRSWTDTFDVKKADLRSTGRNPYFVLEPGYTLTLEFGKERVVKRVLAETKLVDGVETRVVEERETKDGRLVEISRNFFAISATTKDVYYFGEEVDIYTNGRVTSHEGAWRAGVKGARFGLAMPAKPVLTSAYYQEVAPGVAMDRARVVSVTERFTGPAGSFANCVKMEETTPLEPAAKDFKLYAPGVGQVTDGALVLVKYGKETARE